jgi:hypothetical protein
MKKEKQAYVCAWCDLLLYIDSDYLLIKSGTSRAGEMAQKVRAHTLR